MFPPIKARKGWRMGGGALRAHRGGRGEGEKGGPTCRKRSAMGPAGAGAAGGGERGRGRAPQEGGGEKKLLGFFFLKNPFLTFFYFFKFCLC